MKLPVPRNLRQGSKYVGRALQKRQNTLTDPKVTDYGPGRSFEPFPIAVTEANKIEIIKKVVSPLGDMTYEEQLQKKESFCRNVLREIARELYKIGTPVRLDITRLPCPVNSIVRSPEIYKWRNKDEFSVWRGHDGKTETVGFMAFPIKKHGDTVCIEPNGCDIMKDESIRVADILQGFIREKTKSGVCYQLGQEGGWRRFMVRSNTQADLMVVGIMSPRTLLVRQVLEERELFKSYMLEKFADTDLRLKSLYFQPCPHAGCRHQDVPFELLYGEPTITETINQFKFSVSPESYLTPNTKAAELLQKSIIKMIDDCFPAFKELKKKPLVIDLSCNVGVISIHLADKALRVIGIDRSEQAVGDAKVNAQLNGIDNCEFVAADPEIVLERVLEKYSQHRNETLVVCNPPKSGLHKNVINALRNCKEVTKIIYVSSSPGRKHTIDNFIELCCKTQGRGLPPFVPVSATPVDAYPHLEACELVVALERLPE